MARGLFRRIMQIMVFMYRLTGGRFGGRVQGLPVLLLTTTGRKSGKERTTPLGHFEHDGGLVVIGSNAGFDTHPAWFHNLRSNPSAVVQLRREQFDVTAQIVGSEQRERLWARLVELAPGYAAYAQRTTREIPLVILRPVTS